MGDIIHIDSVSDIHRLLGFGKPKHPLVMLIPHNCIDIDAISTTCSLGLYVIAMKNGVSGSIKYGLNSYDFSDGVMLFLSPGQVIESADMVIDKEAQGWSLLFHPDLIRRTSLGQRINQYSFFSYDVNEALHISDDEMQILNELTHKISRELEQSIDKHTQSLISANIELLLDYCVRFYDRQFFTRSNKSKDTVLEFEALIRGYFQQEKHLEHGLPSVAYCGKELGISPNYLSDLLKKETGKTAKEHIQLFVIELAKNKLLGSEHTISQIAYELGFDYPAHFTKLFKNATGHSPSEFRKLN